MKQRIIYRKSMFFVLWLVLSLPFYSALVLADLTVTRNTGKANVTGFVDAGGDTWTLEVNALIPGQSISPAQVRVNGFPFDTCNSGVGGSSACRYTFNFESSTIFETTYPLDIKLFKSGETDPTNSVTSSLVADGSAPLLTNVRARQSPQDTVVSFTVDEEPASCVGLHKIEFFDAASGTLLKKLEGAALASKISSPCGSNTLSESVPLSSSTTVSQSVRVAVSDLLNHTIRATSNSFVVDKITPTILDNTLRVGSFASFLPSVAVTVPISINISENQDYLDAFATSSVLGMSNESATCTKTNLVNGIFTCVWQSRQVHITQPFSLLVVASDGVNSQVKTVNVGLNVDSTPPHADFFGTTRVFNGVNYVRPLNNTFVAKFTETQSGMDTVSVLADFSSINPIYGTRRQADTCTPISSTQWSCFWNGIDANGGGPIFLVQARDIVGNEETSLPRTEVFFDTTSPVIDNISIVALAGQTGAARDYFQSGDILRITFTIVEANGVTGQVDTSQIVSGGSVTSARCTLQSGSTTTFSCTLTTGQIVSGYIPAAEIRLLAEDTSGNRAEKLTTIEILAADSQTQPDFWQRSDVSCSPDGLDINTVKLASQRVFCSIPLHTGAQDIALASTQLVGCTGANDKLSKAFLIGNFAGSTTPITVLEFKPFTDKVNSLTYECTLRLFTRRSTLAFQQPEEERFNITVPFFVTPFDKELGSIQQEIDDAKDEADSGFYGVIGVLNDITKWAKIICSTVMLLADVVRRVMNAFNVGLEGLRGNPFTFPVAVAGCATAEGVGSGGEFFLFTVFKPVCDIVTCRKSTLNIFSSDAGAWWDQKVTAPYYKVGTLGLLKNQNDLTAARTALVDPSSSLPSAIVNLCLPGIIYNLEKLRQVQCRYVSCLENEVKSGVATVQSCRELRDYMECKYVWGNLFQAIPFVALTDALFNKIKQIFSDPIGVLRLGATLLCTKGCAWSNSGTVTCNVLAWVFGALDLYNDIASLATGFQTINEDYCSQVLD